MLAPGNETLPQKPLWIGRVAPLSEAELNEKVAQRIGFLEDKLQDHGLTLTCGAEQEFVLLGRDGKLSLKEINTDDLQKKIEQAGIRFVERAYPEDTEESKYEVVLGTKTAPSLPEHPAHAIASEVIKLRSALNDEFEPHDQVSFVASYPNSTSTAGLHMNYGLAGMGGNNLFYNKERDDGSFSSLAEQCARNLVKLQQEGLALYGQDKAFYERLTKHSSVPGFFGVHKEKGLASVALRRPKNNVFEGEESYHLEDRLPAANSNPYLAALAGVGALFHTVDVFSKPAGGIFLPDIVENPGEDVPWKQIPRDSERALRAFRESSLWQEVAGPELHAEIVSYLAAQQAKSTSVGMAPTA